MTPNTSGRFHVANAVSGDTMYEKMLYGEKSKRSGRDRGAHPGLTIRAEGKQ